MARTETFPSSHEGGLTSTKTTMETNSSRQWNVSWRSDLFLKSIWSLNRGSEDLQHRHALTPAVTRAHKIYGESYGVLSLTVWINNINYLPCGILSRSGNLLLFILCRFIFWRVEWKEHIVKTKLATLKSRCPEDNVHRSIYFILFPLVRSISSSYYEITFTVYLLGGGNFPGCLTSVFCVYDVGRCLLVWKKSRGFISARYLYIWLWIGLPAV
jgi:hypothetical protein